MDIDFISTQAVPKFYFLDPKPEDIHASDIARALAQTCRFGGHSKVYYSVAEHSIIVAENLEKKDADPVTVLAGLLHDASEAYLPDIQRPIKLRMLEARAIYAKLHETIMTKYHLQSANWERIKEIDDRLLLTEAMALGLWNENWEDNVSPLVFKLHLWNSETAEMLFLANFVELSEKCYDYVLRT